MIEAQRWLDNEVAKSEERSDVVSVDDNTILDRLAKTDALLDATVPASKKRKNTPATKNKQRTLAQEYNEEDFEPGFGPLPPGATDGFNPNIKLTESGEIVYKTEEERRATKLVSSDVDQTKPIRIHTDGSSLGNGQKGAVAGVGVYFGPGDAR